MALIGPEHIEPGETFPVIGRRNGLIEIRWWSVVAVFPTVVRAESEGAERTFSITFVRYCLTAGEDLFG